MRSARSLPRAVRNARHVGGMTLIEVLVTLVIISVGLLGVAALQLTTVRNNQNAYVRSQAAMLAGDMFDRMRANRRTANNERAERYVIPIDEEDVPNTPEGEDIARWRQVLDEQLPGGRGGIAYNAESEIVTITIEWGERSDNPNDQTLRFTTSSRI